MPRTQDLAIFVPTTTTTTDGQTDCFTPCACARGNDMVGDTSNEAPWCKTLSGMPRGYKFVRMTIVRFYALVYKSINYHNYAIVVCITDFFTFTLTEHSGHTFVNLGIIYYAQGVNNLETESETNKLAIHHRL